MLRLLALLEDKFYFVLRKEKGGARLSVVIGPGDRSKCWSPLFYLLNLNSSLGQSLCLAWIGQASILFSKTCIT